MLRRKKGGEKKGGEKESKDIKRQGRKGSKRISIKKWEKIAAEDIYQGVGIRSPARRSLKANPSNPREGK
jgi:hypothetical protein